MEKIVLAVCGLLFYAHAAVGQLLTPRFQTTLYLEDLHGNKDSVVIGLDSLGTWGLDPLFGEVDIHNQPWDSVFEVRVASGDYRGFSGNEPHSKVQIIEDICDIPFINARTNVLTVLVRTNAGVIVRWDSQDFQDPCIDSSVIVDTGIFFNTPGPYGETFMAHQNVHGTLLNLPHYPYGYSMETIEGGGTDTIFFLYVGFVDDIRGLISTRPRLSDVSVEVFPNPATDAFVVELPEDQTKARRLAVFDVSGRQVYEALWNNQTTLRIPCRDWAKGLYFYQILFEDGQFARGKLVKE